MTEGSKQFEEKLLQEPLVDTPAQQRIREEPTAAGVPSKHTGETTVVRLLRKGPFIIYTVLLLVSSVGNTIFFKRMTTAMPNYSWFLTQLSTLIYVPIFAVLAGTSIFAQTKRQLLKKFGVMGAFDSASGVFMVLGGVRTSGTMQLMLQQSAIPLSVLFSILILKKRYHSVQHLGAAAIILGILLAKVDGAPSGSSMADENNPLFNVIFFMAVVPAALSSVYKEVAFRGHDGDLDVNLLQFWVASFQVVGNFLAMPIYTLSLLGTQRVPLNAMLGQTVRGSQCLFGEEDSLARDCGLEDEISCDHCEGAWIQVLGYLAFNLLFNVFSVLVIKHGSASASFLVATLRLPIATLAFSLPAIAGSSAVSLRLSDFVGLGVVIVGLGTYRYGSRLLKREMRIESASPAGRRRRLAKQPVFAMGPPGAQPSFVVAPHPIQPRSAERVRSDLIGRLGAASPLHSPKNRGRSPPTSPYKKSSLSPNGSNYSTPSVVAYGPPLNDEHGLAAPDFALNGFAEAK